MKTPEERAEALFEIQPYYALRRHGEEPDPDDVDYYDVYLAGHRLEEDFDRKRDAEDFVKKEVKTIADVIRQAVEEEREACFEAVDAIDRPYIDLAAQAIRDRGIK